MIFHENCLLADNSHVISYLIFSEIRKIVAKFVVCCSSDWCFKVLKCILEAQKNLLFLQLREAFCESCMIIKILFECVINFQSLGIFRAKVTNQKVFPCNDL